MAGAPARSSSTCAALAVPPDSRRPQRGNGHTRPIVPEQLEHVDRLPGRQRGSWGEGRRPAGPRHVHNGKIVDRIGMHHQAEHLLAIAGGDVDHRGAADQIGRGRDQPRLDIEAAALVAVGLEPHQARRARVERRGEHGRLGTRAVLATLVGIGPRRSGCPAGGGHGRWQAGARLDRGEHRQRGRVRIRCAALPCARHHIGNQLRPARLRRIHRSSPGRPGQRSAPSRAAAAARLASDRIPPN